MTPPRPPDLEAARLAALQRYEILDTPEEAEFDELARLAAHVCQTPVALLSFAASGRQWLKSKVGIVGHEILSDDSISRHALSHDGLFVVPDTRLDSRFQDVSSVAAEPGVRFYASSVLKSSDGLPLGILCVLDHEPRNLSEVQGQALEMLGRQVMTIMELRLARRRLHNTIESISDAVVTLDHDFQCTYVNGRAERVLGRGRDELLGQVIWNVCDLKGDSPFATQFRRAAAERQIVTFEEYYAPASAWLEVRAYPSAEGVTVYFQDVTSRRKRKEQLRLLETCVSRLNDIVLITEAEPVDEPGPRILYVNDAFVRRTGYAREEVIGKSPRFLQGPKTQRDGLDRIRVALQNFKPVREELINYTKSGEEFWLELDIVPVMDGTGRIAHSVAIERDVTERKQAEAALRVEHQEYEQRHSALVALTRSALRLAGDEMAALREITETVSRALNVGRVSVWRFNAGRTAIVCQNLFEAASNAHSSGGELRAESFPSYFRALAENEVIAADNAREDPRTREFAATYLEPIGITSMLDAPVLVSGVLGGVLCVEHLGPRRQWSHGEQSFAVSVTNLVSLMLSQRAQARSEARLRAVVESEPECVKVVSLDGLLLDMNPAGLRMIEAGSLDLVLGCPVRRLIHPDDEGAFIDLHRRVCQGETCQLEFRMIGLQGTQRWMETHATPLHEADGKIGSLVSVTRDVTERKLAEQRLARLNRLYQMLSKTNEAIVRVTGRQQLLEAVCQIAVDPGQFVLAAIVVVEAETGRVVPLASAGLEEGYFSEISIVMSDPVLNQGVIGTSLRTGCCNVCNDLANDPRMSAWKAPALRRGYRSAAAFPIKVDGAIVATLVFCAGEADYFKADEIELLEAMAEDLSFAIQAQDKEQKRLQAEAALRASEASMAAAQRIAHFGSWELELVNQADLDGNSLRWSDEMYRLAGFEPGSVEVTNELFFQLAHADDHKSIRQAVAEAIRERRQYSITHRLIRPNGDQRIVHEAAQIFFDEATGAPLRMVGTAHDITDQQLAEEALRESEERFRGTFEQAAVGIAHVSPESRFLRVNDKLCDILGYDREELLRCSAIDITLPEHRAAGQAARLAMLAAEQSSYTTEKCYLRKDGRPVWVNLATTLERTPAGKPKYFISVFEDITVRKQAEEKLREQATLLDKAQDAILVQDLEHRILYWNQSAERLYGWTAAEALGRSVKELLYRDHTEFLAGMEAVLAKGEWIGELHQSNRDGQSLTVEARWTLVRDDHGNPRTVLAIHTDVTERKRMEQQFFRAQRMESIGTLAGGIAHDLNNVLAPILMSIELLRLEEKNPRRLSILSTIEGSARRGAEMVKQVLSFAKGVSGQQVDVRMGPLIQEIEKITNETFLKNIHVCADIPRGLWTVKGDPTQLHQVLLNLCVNARDAMPGGGRLMLSASNQMLDEHYAGMNIDATPGPHVVIQVEDSGTGMPPEVIDRIFEPFFTTKELGKGTGLGLFTTMAIVKSHGGFVRVYSEVGVGTKFHVYLPAQAVSGAADAHLAESELPRGRGELVLVVDDEASVRAITQQTLESFGYRVLLACDGAEATALYAANKKDVSAVLTDMMMPMMDGPTTIQVLMRMNPQVRIIAASGLNVNGMVARATNAGVRHFLPKPYTAEVMLTLLRQLIDGEEKPPGLIPGQADICRT